jgi:hypothetical protein
MKALKIFYMSQAQANPYTSRYKDMDSMEAMKVFYLSQTKETLTPAGLWWLCRCSIIAKPKLTLTQAGRRPWKLRRSI